MPEFSGLARTEAPGWALVGVVLVGGLLAQLALHFLEPALSVTWGYAHLSRSPALYWIALLLAIVLPPLGSLVWRRLEGEPLGPWPRSHVAIALTASVILFVALSLWAPMPALSIDPAVFRLWVMRAEVNPRSDLWLRLLALLTQPLAPLVATWRTALVVTGMLGGVTMVALVGSARRLARDRAEALTMALIACTAFGVMRMSFGVVDVYPVGLVLVALFFWSALRTLDGDGHPAWPLVIGATGLFWYLGLLLLVPAALVLLAEELRWPARRGRAVVGASIATVAAGLATLPATGRAFAFGAFFAAVGRESAAELGSSPTSLHSVEILFSRQHLYDVVNTCMMVDAVGILCSITAGAWVAAHVLRARTWDVRAVMLGGTAVGQLLYLATFDQLFSPARQWDLFTFASVATALFGGWALVRWLRQAPGGRKGWLVGLAVALALVHLIARLGASHLDLERHEAESPPTWPTPARPSDGPDARAQSDRRAAAPQGRQVW